MTSAIAEKIAAHYHISEDEAIVRLYAMLEQEKTKVWQFSISKLFELYKEETERGVLDFPDY